jgi:hypothetical protein
MRCSTVYSGRGRMRSLRASRKTLDMGWPLRSANGAGASSPRIELDPLDGALALNRKYIIEKLPLQALFLPR